MPGQGGYEQVSARVSPVRSGFDDVSVFLTTIWLSFLAFRNDDQKYRQQGKTTSRKAQKRSEGKGKGHKGKWNLKNVWMCPKAVSMEKLTHFTLKLFVYRHQRQSDSEAHETFWKGWICRFPFFDFANCVVTKWLSQLRVTVSLLFCGISWCSLLWVMSWPGALFNFINRRNRHASDAHSKYNPILSQQR